MDLLDRYLEAVRKHLPWQRQDDIIAELRANFESQLEEKEAALGRPLTQLEAEEWLKKLGSPMQVAAGYQPQQYLIGPGIFPTYRHVLKLVCAWVLIIYSIVAVMHVFAAQSPSVTALIVALLRLPFVLVSTAAWVTLAFAGIEYAVAHHYVKLPAVIAPSPGWTPSSLPPLGAGIAHGKKPRSYAQAVAEVVFGIFFLGWLLLVPQHPWLLMGPGAFFIDSLPYRLADIWVPAYWCLVVLSSLQLGWNALNLGRGRWQKSNPAFNLLFRAVGLVPVMLLLNAKDHVTILLKHPALDHARLGASLDTINRVIHTGLTFLCALVCLSLIWETVQLVLHVYRKRAAAIQ